MFVQSIGQPADCKEPRRWCVCVRGCVCASLGLCAGGCVLALRYVCAVSLWLAFTWCKESDEYLDITWTEGLSGNMVLLACELLSPSLHTSSECRVESFTGSADLAGIQTVAFFFTKTTMFINKFLKKRRNVPFWLLTLGWDWGVAKALTNRYVIGILNKTCVCE